MLSSCASLLQGATQPAKVTHASADLLWLNGSGPAARAPGARSATWSPSAAGVVARLRPGGPATPWAGGLSGREPADDYSDQPVPGGEEMGKLVAFGFSKRRPYPDLSVAPGAPRGPAAAAPVADPLTGRLHADIRPKVGQPVSRSRGKDVPSGPARRLHGIGVRAAACPAICFAARWPIVRPAELRPEREYRRSRRRSSSGRPSPRGCPPWSRT